MKHCLRFLRLVKSAGAVLLPGLVFAYGGSQADGLDIEGVDVNGDGRGDNQFGGLVAALSNELDIPLQEEGINAVNLGEIIVLHRHSLVNSFLVEAPSTQPCSKEMVCGCHLDGQTDFEIADSSPPSAALEGGIVRGSFLGGPERFTIEFPLFENRPPITLDRDRLL